MKTIDLRSDTVTTPTEEMRRVMFEAEVGDDVYGEDPTVNRLETLAAELLGKEAGLFTASGTMSNLIAVLSQTRPGDEIILGHESHIFWYEVGGASALGGVMMRTLPNDNEGQIDLDDIKGAIRGRNIHFPKTSLLCLENTHNRCGGAVLTPEYTGAVSNLAHEHDLRVHLDGARIFNAAVALNISPRELTGPADSVGVCLSKALSAPIGSVLTGDREFINRARKFRKMLGGGMRQVGIIAAAGIIALEKMINRLADDHQNAQRLASGLKRIPSIVLTREKVPTNIVFFGLDASISENAFNRKLIDRGVKVSYLGEQKYRAVTHRLITETDIVEALKHIEAVIKEMV
jgi:threonine aldolase